MAWKGFKDVQATILIDLTKDEKELWNNLKDDAKRYLKKSFKQGLVFEESKNWEDFYPIYEKVAIFGKIKPKPLEELKKGNYNLLAVKYESKLIGGIAIDFKDNIPYMMINAIDSDFYNTRAGYFVYWNMILWAKKSGYNILDLGGYQLNSKPNDKLYNINQFKEKWGGEIKVYEIYSKNPFYILGRKVIRNIHWIKKARDSIKMKLYLLKKSISEKGFLNLLKIFFKRFIYDRKTMIIFFSEEKCNLKPKIEVKFKEIGIEEFKSMSNNISDEELEKRFSQKNECFVFLKGTELTHYSWLGKEMNISEIRKKIDLNEKEACIFDCFTEEKFRGNNLYPAMLCKIRDLKKKEFAKFYIYAEKANENSIKGIERAGFKEEKRINYLNLFGLKSYR